MAKMADVEISRLRYADVDKAVALFKNVVNSMSYYKEVEKEDEIKDFGRKEVLSYMKWATFIVAKSGTKIVGLITCYPNKRSGICWIDWFMVENSFRNKGVGKALYKKAESIIRKKSHAIWLDVSPKNKRAISFYKRMGYKKLFSVKDWGYHNNYIFMIKRLK